ncbi:MULTISPECIES: hypothetical protein [unclassified Microbacterium]|uniref:hypothetical protein n=1 Tax=unclassified Microbacterium TaxID=2609290 RepID=UPI000EAA0C95|nr:MULTISPECIES: hypothetical protein [unclassified Microbacterium]MBT2485931.1 hypothetical protein [Microbacterium sp. ISL-108]RKN68680.1 hypothetical protein D7252_14570 [Microbacterium sp. CGR2]
MSDGAHSSTPSAVVLRDFRATGAGERLDGGRGLTWRFGDTVLRPVDGDEEARWKSQVLSTLDQDPAFIVPRPIRSVHGDWVCEHWQAMEWIPGTADPRRLDDIIRAGAAFHRATAHLERPSFIDESVDPWSRADRVAWQEEAAPDDPLLAKLIDEYQMVSAPSQVVHGDLLGNVLFAPGRPPAVIDWAPYWRPAGFGAAVAAVDAACWHALPLAQLHHDHGVDEWRQLLMRALVFRMATLHLDGLWHDGDVPRHAPVVVAVLGMSDAAATVGA